MPEEEVRKIEIAYPQAFCRAARLEALVCGVMTSGRGPEARMKYAKIIGQKEKAVESVKFDFLGVYRPGVILGNSNTPATLATSCRCCTGPCHRVPLDPQERPRARDGGAVGGRRSLRSNMATFPEADCEDPGIEEMQPFFVRGETREQQ